MTRKPTALLSGIGIALVAAAGLLAGTGCTELGDEFRTAAGPKLESGITDVLTGIVSGAFEVFEPGKGEDSSGTSSDGSSA